MNIIIVGGGKVGSYLATLLGNRGYNVHIVESRKAVAQRLEEKLPEGSVVRGMGSSPDVLEEAGVLQADVFRASVIELPEEETQRRKDATNPEWPIAHVVLHGVSRDQFMARHKANHAQLVYAPDAETADKALVAKAAMLQGMGIKVNLIGDVNN